MKIKCKVVSINKGRRRKQIVENNKNRRVIIEKSRNRRRVEYPAIGCEVIVAFIIIFRMCKNKNIQ
jgi:hypothetical protein